MREILTMRSNNKFYVCFIPSAQEILKNLIIFFSYNEISGFKRLPDSNLRHGQTRIVRVGKQIIAAGHVSHAYVEKYNIGTKIWTNATQARN